MTQDELFKVLVAHCKEYGFIFPSSEIYDGLAAVYDYGQMGVQLKQNIKTYWWEAMTRLHENIVGIDSAIFMHPRIWEASGHVGAQQGLQEALSRRRPDRGFPRQDRGEDQQGGREGPQALRRFLRRGPVPRDEPQRPPRAGQVG